MAVTFPKFIVNSLSFFFITMKGRLPPSALTTVEITRPGVNGHSFKKDGIKGKRYTLVVTMGVNGKAAADTERARHSSWQGQVISLQHDSMFSAITGQFVDNADVGLASKVVAASTSFGTVDYLFDTTFTMVDTRIP